MLFLCSTEQCYYHSCTQAASGPVQRLWKRTKCNLLWRWTKQMATGTRKENYFSFLSFSRNLGIFKTTEAINSMALDFQSPCQFRFNVSTTHGPLRNKNSKAVQWWKSQPTSLLLTPRSALIWPDGENIGSLSQKFYRFQNSSAGQKEVSPSRGETWAGLRLLHSWAQNLYLCFFPMVLDLLISWEPSSENLGKKRKKNFKSTHYLS